MHLDSPSIQTQPVSETTPEIDIYLGYLLVLFLHDQNQIDLGMQTTKQIILPKLSALNKRSLDILAARIFFYLARFYELKGEWMVLRNILLELHRTATLRHDVESQVIIIPGIFLFFLGNVIKLPTPKLPPFLILRSSRQTRLKNNLPRINMLKQPTRPLLLLPRKNQGDST